MASYKNMYEQEKKISEHLMEMLFQTEAIDTGMWKLEAEGADQTFEEYKEEWMQSLRVYVEDVLFGDDDYGETEY